MLGSAVALVALFIDMTVVSAKLPLSCEMVTAALEILLVIVLVAAVIGVLMAFKALAPPFAAMIEDSSTKMLETSF